ncbi:MAG: DUF4912 domain-containing protein [Planctomycetes bacterium]|nr:DUF4912 domain-containing protein [Planctomycetota bacterium]
MDARQGSSRKQYLQSSEEQSENTSYSLQGGCAFIPHVVGQELYTVKQEPGNPSLRMIMGCGEVEATGQPCTEPVSRKTPGKGVATPEKQEFSSDQLRKICQDIKFKLPAAIGDSMFVLLAVSPNLMHAYWEISRHQVAQARKLHGAAIDNANLILRFHEIAFLGSKESLNQFEISIAEPCDNWYAHTWNNGKRFFAEIGLQMNPGGFHRLASSNCILLPPATPGEAGPANLSSLLDYMFVKENTLPVSLPLPEVFSVFAEQEAAQLDEILDESWRDTHAERHVRDVYRRILAEGPRVLHKRPGILPTPHEKRVDEYHTRQETRRKTRKENLRKPLPKLPAEEAADRELSADVLALINLEDSLGGVCRPAAKLNSRQSRSQEDSPDKHAFLNEEQYDPEHDLLASILAEEPALALHASEAAPAQFNNSWREEEPQEPLHFAGTFASSKPEPQGHTSLLAILSSSDSTPQESASSITTASSNSSLASLCVKMQPSPLQVEDFDNTSADFSGDFEDEEITLEPLETEAVSVACPEPEQDDSPAPLDSPQTLEIHQHFPEITPENNLGDSLKITASLTLRGTTPKDSTLLLDGREVPTESDGSFEIECTLDEGKLGLPFELHSTLHPELRQCVDIGIDIMKRTQHEAWDCIRIRKP